MHELQRARGRQELARVPSERLACRQAEHGPNPFASAEQRVAQRLLEPAEVGRKRQLTEELVRKAAQLVEAARHGVPFWRSISACTSFASWTRSWRTSTAASESSAAWRRSRAPSSRSRRSWSRPAVSASLTGLP